MRQVKVEWCENWIKKTFAKIPFPNGGIESNCFWRMAEASGLWERGTYGSPMSKAVSELVNLEFVQDDNRDHLYTVFRLK